MRLMVTAGAFELVYAVQTPEHAEQLVHILNIKTNAAVLHKTEGLFPLTEAPTKTLSISLARLNLMAFESKLTKFVSTICEWNDVPRQRYHQNPVLTICQKI
jgi:hypothetical protein